MSLLRLHIEQTAYSALPNLRSHLKIIVMAQEQPTDTTALKIRHFDTDEVFRMINDPFRRAVIRALAAGGMKTASDLGWGPGMRRHNKLKHLAALCKAGILVQKENLKDARQCLFGLSPAAVVCQNGKCAECRIRLLHAALPERMKNPRSLPRSVLTRSL